MARFFKNLSRNFNNSVNLHSCQSVQRAALFDVAGQLRLQFARCVLECHSVDLEDAKKGRFVIKEDGKDAVTVNATGDDKNASLELKSADGTVEIGGGQNAKVPTWIPDYPGSAPQAAYSAQAKAGDSGMFTFKTRDAADKVAHFYEEGFKSAGMKTSSTLSNGDSGTAGGMVTGEDESKKHTATVLIGAESGETTVTLNFAAKR